MSTLFGETPADKVPPPDRPDRLDGTEGRWTSQGNLDVVEYNAWFRDRVFLGYEPFVSCRLSVPRPNQSTIPRGNRSQRQCGEAEPDSLQLHNSDRYRREPANSHRWRM